LRRSFEFRLAGSETQEQAMQLSFAQVDVALYERG
jgi:hypothetical protein